MKKVLFTTLISNDLGLLTRSLPIAYELRARGYQVAFCNPAIAPRKLISDAGFDNLLSKWPLHYIISGDTSSGIKRLMQSGHIMKNLGILGSVMRHMKQFSTAEFWNFDQLMWYMGMWNEKFVLAEVNTMVEIINEFNPDAVVDFWNVSSCIAARTSHKPLITVIQADMHPLSDGFIWWKEQPSDLPTPTATINKILKKFQLSTISKIGELIIGDLTMVVGMPKTDPLPENANVNYIGAILWERPDEKLPDWIEELDKMTPVIWLYPGNPRYARGTNISTDSAIVTRGCIEALKNQDVQVVLSTGHQPLLKDSLPLPSNFRHTDFIPGLAMAERSDLLIHHGGYGSCQTGLYSGTPTVVIPTYSERESNARRIASVGAGEFILPITDSSGRKKRIDTEELQTKIKDVLSIQSYKENARKIGKDLIEFGGASKAASLIEEYINR